MISDKSINHVICSHLRLGMKYLRYRHPRHIRWPITSRICKNFYKRRYVKNNGSVQHCYEGFHNVGLKHRSPIIQGTKVLINDLLSPFGGQNDPNAKLLVPDPVDNDLLSPLGGQNDPMLGCCENMKHCDTITFTTVWGLSNTTHRVYNYSN